MFSSKALADKAGLREGMRGLDLCSALGAGQTIASQGILHGGLKYSLSGLLEPSSRAVADMPARWNASLRGQTAPDLRDVRVLSPCCYLWRTQSLRSRAGLLAAQADPQKYSNLLVRVTGYNAYFVTLGRGMQDEIIARTSHGNI